MPTWPVLRPGRVGAIMLDHAACRCIPQAPVHNSQFIDSVVACCSRGAPGLRYAAKVVPALENHPSQAPRRRNAATRPRLSGVAAAQRRACRFAQPGCADRARLISLDASIRRKLKDTVRGGQTCSMGSSISRNSLTRTRLGTRLSFIARRCCIAQSFWQRCAHWKRSFVPISPGRWRPASTRRLNCRQPRSRTARADGRDNQRHINRHQWHPH